MNAKANNTIDKVRELQRKLYLSAKANKKRKIHALYDKVYREDIIRKAWKQVKENDGVGGIDEVSINDIKTYGEEEFLKEISQELRENRYNPNPVKRVYIPKKDGSQRPLGIPVIKDRIIQVAVKIVMEPIFEADFKEYSYGFRVRRSAHDALKVIRKECNKGGWWVIDADITNYFGSINHDKLMILIQQRINDRRILRLILKWLKCVTMENGEYTATAVGSVQGGAISPLLANIYLNYLDTVWEKHYSHLGTLVKYADDFIVISKSRKDILRLDKRNLKYHSMTQVPSSKAMKSMRAKIKSVFYNKTSLQNDIIEMIKMLNKKLNGFKNYYVISYCSRRHLKKIDWYVTLRFTIWYRLKKQLRQRCRYTGELMTKIKQFGLVNLSY